MDPIATHLWFDTQARQAAEWYASLVPGSRINTVRKLHDTPSGDAELVSFDLGGRAFMAISAGPLFKFNPSVSLHLRRPTTQDIDAAWGKLIEGGTILMPLDSYPFNERFGWVQDRYGLSWQVMLGPATPDQPAIVPALMFTQPVAGKAEEAITLYTSVFKSPAPTIRSRYGSGEAPDREGTVRIASFTLRGQEFSAMDSAHPHGFTFNEAISLVVPCDTQEEIDYYWRALSADPAAEQCGWLKDKYGLSWQVVPDVLFKLMRGPKGAKVMQAFMKMRKFDVAALKKAAA